MIERGVLGTKSSPTPRCQALPQTGQRRGAAEVAMHDVLGPVEAIGGDPVEIGVGDVVEGGQVAEASPRSCSHARVLAS